jgi:hypothetical protein
LTVANVYPTSKPFYFEHEACTIIQDHFKLNKMLLDLPKPSSSTAQLELKVRVVQYFMSRLDWTLPR